MKYRTAFWWLHHTKRIRIKNKRVKNTKKFLTCNKIKYWVQFKWCASRLYASIVRKKANMTQWHWRSNEKIITLNCINKSSITWTQWLLINGWEKIRTCRIEASYSNGKKKQLIFDKLMRALKLPSNFEFSIWKRLYLATNNSTAMCTCQVNKISCLDCTKNSSWYLPKLCPTQCNVSSLKFLLKSLVILRPIRREILDILNITRV